MAIRTGHKQEGAGQALTPAQAEKFRRRAIYAARRFGFYDDAEDFAQEILLTFAEGRRKSSTVDQVLIDVIRARFGRPGLPGHAARLALENAFSIFDEDGSFTVEPSTREPRDDLQDFERLIGLLDLERDRALLREVYIEGKLLREIGSDRGVSESRISQLVHSAEKRLLKAVTLGGEKVGIELEVRTCACGCGLTFKCLPGSGQKYRSLECQEKATGTKVELTRAKQRRVTLVQGGEMKQNAVALAEEVDEIDQAEDIEEQEPEYLEPVPAGAVGRFTMTIPDAAERFSIRHERIRKWIKKGLLQCHRPTPRKTYIDPSDIGRIIEGDLSEPEEKLTSKEVAEAPVKETSRPKASKVDRPRRKYTKRASKPVAKISKKLRGPRLQKKPDSSWKRYVAYAGAGLAAAAGVFIAVHLR